MAACASVEDNRRDIFSKGDGVLCLHNGSSAADKTKGADDCDAARREPHPMTHVETF